MSRRLEFAIKTAQAAGRMTLEPFRARIGYELKSDESPVTVADRQAEAFVRARIESEFPGEPVLGEEQGGATEGDRWVIDPIDGTKSFIAGVPLYATLLSYERDGEPVLGVCVLPALDETVYATKGGGCFWNGEPCRVSEKTRIEDSILCCGSHHTMHQAGRLHPFLALAERAMATRGLTDAYGHVLVATGRVEAMVDPVVSHWDVSAIAVIVREAGGSFTDFLGNETLASEAVSCAPGLRDEVLGAFRT